MTRWGQVKVLFPLCKQSLQRLPPFIIFFADDRQNNLWFVLFFSHMHSLAAWSKGPLFVFTAFPSSAWNWQYVGWPDESLLMRLNHLVIYERTHRLFLQPGINLLETGAWQQNRSSPPPDKMASRGRRVAPPRPPGGEIPNQRRPRVPCR